MREYADEDRLDEIEDALTAPNRLDPVTRAPLWWHGEDDAWSAYQPRHSVDS